jgi:predicted nucleotidyltransferase
LAEYNDGEREGFDIAQGGGAMPQTMQNLIEQYVSEIKKIYGSHLCKVILYGSYARGDFRLDSDVDIMILVDMSDLDLKTYSQQLSYMTYDFNLDHNLDIKPIAKSEAHFRKWVENYPFYSNINKEGVVLYGAA